MVPVERFLVKENSNPVSMIMKKLLVILLLFFPVHGAWGEIITLSCSYYQIFMTKSSSSHKIDPPMTKIFRFDFQKERLVILTAH